MVDAIRAQDASSSTVGDTPPSDAANARDLVASATDPRTGAVDTEKLAHWIADARTRDFAAASQAYSAIEQQLVTRNPADAARFNQDVVGASKDSGGSSPIPGTGLANSLAPALRQTGSQILADNPVLQVRWESTTSQWTGKGGFTPGLARLLESHGIQIEPKVNPAPSGSLGRQSGMSTSQANNVNGNLARDAIADRYRAQGLNTRTEVARPGGGRRVDVQVEVPHASDPRLDTRIQVESKVGRTSLEPGITEQVTKDAQALARNGLVRNAGRALEVAGKIARPIGLALDAVQVGEAFHADGNRVGTQTLRTASSLAGGAAGGWAGVEAGAAIGTMVGGPVGTVVGGIVGGAVGAFVGSGIAQSAFDKIKSWF